MAESERKRIPSHRFDLPVHELRLGYRSDVYFWREKRTLERHAMHPVVTMQIFQKNHAILCGIDEVMAVLRVATGRYADYKEAAKIYALLSKLKVEMRRLPGKDTAAYERVVKERYQASLALDVLWQEGFDQLEIAALQDGDIIDPHESVMHITGDASLFAHLETIYLGILARRTRIATNVRRVVEAAKGKVVLYFPARFDHWAVQEGDGYAAHIGGADGVSTGAQGAWWGGQPSGTVPHALIASVGGDTVQAVTLFNETYPELNLVALVDFDNDCIRTALDCAQALGDKLWGVRLDTSEMLVDQSLISRMGSFNPTGVAPELVRLMRDTLDREGFDGIKIVVSGGFDADRIAAFEAAQIPVDAYGVGQAFMAGSSSFTADVVLVDGKPCAKVGRQFRPNDRLVRVVS